MMLARARSVGDGRRAVTNSGAILVVGATSGAGKSTVAAALCRSWRRRGLDVAPFKAQNMSNHAAVTADGGEVGRAQAMQASAAGIDVERRMNPVLLKPNSRHGSHVVVLGDEVQTTDAATYGAVADSLKATVLDALDSLRRDHAWLVGEGAGGAAEINLLERDLVNLPLARAAGIPAVLVVDIDRGGAFASAHGSIDLLPPELRSTVIGVVFNQFRGDPSLLADGITELERRTGVPVLGVLPHLGHEPLLGVEDSLDIVTSLPSIAAARERSRRPVRVAVIRLPHLANPSDLDPFLIEPDVALRWVTGPDSLDGADLVVVPGSRATVDDLGWLRGQGLDQALLDRAADGVDVVGICAGYQMLGEKIDDTVESGIGEVAGLGLLRSVTSFAEPKIVWRSTGTSAGGDPVVGYQIRFGRPQPAEQRWLTVDGESEGAVSPSGRVRGTSLHGLFDSDAFRSALLGEIAERAGRDYTPAPTTLAAAIDAQHERLADWIEAHLDVDGLVERAATAAAPGAGPGW